MAKYGEFKYGETKYGLHPSYVILLRAGSTPQAGVDAPVANPVASAESATLDMTALSLTADTDYFGSLVPTNKSGFADPPAAFGIRTDGAGNPSLAPAAVTNLRAVPLAGGKAKIEWDYVEPNPMALAERFDIYVNPPAFPVRVDHVQHQRHYVYETAAMPDGLRSVEVVASRGLGESPFVTVKVRADATPPAETPLAISAT
jgi:hypothetical protein